MGALSWRVWAITMLFSLPLNVSAQAVYRESDTLRVMTFNIWVGGELVDFSKVVEAIRAADADVVGLQEASGNTRRLADALGWPYASEQHTVISKLPLITPPGGDESLIWIQLRPGKVVALANIHLPSDPYGPYAVRDGAAIDEVLELEKVTRLPEISAHLQGWTAQAQRGIPTFITGDFNTPSHHDWTAAVATARDDVKYSVFWPVTAALERAGFRDTYRTAHPDPVAAPGITWTYGYPYPRVREDEVIDRIDFVFVNGNAEVIKSEIVGPSGSPDVDISVSPFPSDHRSVVSTVRVRPGTPPVFVSPDRFRLEVGDPLVVRYHSLGGEAVDRIVVVQRGGDAAKEALMWLPPYEADYFGSVTFGSGALEPGGYDVALLSKNGAEVARSPFRVVRRGAVVSVKTDKRSYEVGEHIEVSWIDAPANRADWLGIYRSGDANLYSGYLGFIYTGATVQGRKTFGPVELGKAMLPPGSYTLRYFIDDGYTLSNQASFTVR